MQLVADKLVQWCADKHEHLNTLNTKDMVIYFGKQYSKSELAYA